MKKNGQNQRTGKILLIALLSLLAGSLVQAQEAEEKVFEKVAVMPIFNDGDVNTFRNWVMQNVKFPEAARKDKVTGRVRAGFIVEKDGSVKKVKIIKGVPEYFDDEVVRVIKSSPKWAPGKNKEGETVRVSFEITVNFELK